MGSRNTVTVGGAQLELQPLTFAAVKRHRENMRVLSEGQITQADELFDRMSGLVLDSLQRGAPELTQAALEEALDWPTCKAAFEVVMALSFPTRAPGESRAASPSGESIGTS